MARVPAAEAITSAIARNLPPEAAVCVGFSGGLDSTVLLDVLADIADTSGRKVTAVHVHHGLSPNAEVWVKSCERFCANHGIALAVERVRVNAQSSDGLEAAARVARYAVFASRPEPYVALAHHLDDQAETVLMQLLRGTGLKGIAAMPVLRPLRGTGIQVFRPLLEVSRADLLEHARGRNLKWTEDESNASKRQDRNFLRHDVAPLIDERFPGWREAFARFARHAGTAGELLDQLATLDGVPLSAGEALPLRDDLPEERRANALRAFLARNAVAMPSEARLAEISQQLHGARDDARVRIDHAGVSIVRHRGCAQVARGLSDDGPAWRVPWAGEPEVDLGAGRGTVSFERVIGSGIAATRISAGDCHFALRAGGEEIRLAVDRPTRTLKNLLQEHEMPPWQRDRLPLLFQGGRLVWVPGIGIASEYACAPGEEGFSPAWTVAGNAPLC